MRFGIIGNEIVALRCLQHILSFPDAEIAFMIYDPARENKSGAIKKYCEQNRIESFATDRINTHEWSDRIKSFTPDTILSISNYWILNQTLLSIPPKGTINFHNAPPSKYHGINIPSWAIINGEKEHGVMWHYAEVDIDAGDVVGFRKFPIAPEETASSLMVKCIQQGIELFKDLFMDILYDRVTPCQQEKASRYYAKNDLPENIGILDFRWEAEKIGRMVRGLNYLPFRNPFCHARIKTAAGDVIVNQVCLEYGGTVAAPGTVLSAFTGNLKIACKDGLISITQAMNHKNIELTAEEIARILDIRTGDII